MTSNPNSRLRHPSTRFLPLLLIALAALVLPTVTHGQNTTIPTVSSVAITSSPGMDNTYAKGDTITVSLTFSEALTVTGTPYVVVDIGGQPRNFKYSGDGSSATAQPFSYTALVGDRDLDGVSLLVNSLALNGGTIKAADSANATLTHAAMPFANHKVDTQVTLLSSLGDQDAPDTITISATESATVGIRVGDARDQYDINAITLNVKTPSNSLDVTVKLVSMDDEFADYTYTGSVTTAGLQTFTLSEQSVVKFGNVGNLPGTAADPGGGPDYDIKITASGAGSIQLAGTSANVGDSGVVSRLVFPPISGNVTRAKVGVSGSQRFNSAPHIRRRRFESAERERLCCRRPDRHAVRGHATYRFSGRDHRAVLARERRRTPPRGTLGLRGFHRFRIPVLFIHGPARR